MLSQVLLAVNVAVLCGGKVQIVTPPLDYRSWRWPSKLTAVKYAIEQSEWPSFLTYKAWDSCQGCKSASSGDVRLDVSAETFQVQGDWMRVSSRMAPAGVTLSTHASEHHWLNPPRRGTADRPLEFEWFQYFDVPAEWGWEGLLTDLTEVNWSAFWMFGHGKDFYGSLFFYSKNACFYPPGLTMPNV